MNEAIRPLVGEVKTQFTCRTIDDIQPGIELARVDQEAMCGYPLVLVTAHHMNVEGGFEVFVTLGPAPEPTLEPAPEEASPAP